MTVAVFLSAVLKSRRCRLTVCACSGPCGPSVVYDFLLKLRESARSASEVVSLVRLRSSSKQLWNDSPNRVLPAGQVDILPRAEGLGHSLLVELGQAVGTAESCGLHLGRLGRGRQSLDDHHPKGGLGNSLQETRPWAREDRAGLCLASGAPALPTREASLPGLPSFPSCSLSWT